LALLDKLADLRCVMDAEQWSDALGEFDKLAGVDHLYGQDLVDPYLSTFGVKQAEHKHVIGNEQVTDEQLKQFALRGLCTVKKTFGEEFAGEFAKDPVGIFSSLPRDQKKLVIRMATDTAL
jgi:hypothetical protein